MSAVRFAGEHKLLVAVRGGGHNIAGNAVCEGGLMIDLSPMKSVRIDAKSMPARVESGVTLGEFDRDAQAFGLATPVGINSTTGVAGLTLGGGGNFGIVTSFEFRLHKVGPEVLAGLIFHPLDAARDVLRFYRDFIKTTPHDFVCWYVLRMAPPLPFLPAEWHGKGILALAVCYSGDVKEGEGVAKPLRSFGKPIADVIAPMPYVTWQTILDPLLTPGMRNYDRLVKLKKKYDPNNLFRLNQNIQPSV